MRAILTLSARRSRSGDTIWEQKVIPGTVRRSPAFREYILSRTKELHVSDPNDGVEAAAFDMPTERVNDFITRIIKGFLRHFHPEHKYNIAEFQVQRIEPTEDALNNLEKTFAGIPWDERGEDVVRFRHGITNTGLGGIWLLVFYDAVWFLVVHARKPLITT
jgi:hypothetical protein